MSEPPKRHPELTVTQYDGIVQWCQDAIDENKDFLYDVKLFDQAMHDASVRYQIQPTSLNSLMRNTHVWHVKITTRHVKAALSKQNPGSMVHDYIHKGKSLWQIAKSLRYPPYLVARNMLEVLTTIPRKSLTDAMRDPVAKLGNTTVVLRPEYIASESFAGPPRDYDAVDTTRLAREVLHVLAMDPMYGPTHDAARHSIGVEYERLLEELLDKIGIPYETEEQLRQKGTARTPDVLLSTPCAVKMKDDTDDDWRIICWIDSKALFGDAHTHKDSTVPQAESYIHRFGPGLLLYWFGHAPLQKTTTNDLMVTGWTLPDQWLLPTGETIIFYPAT